jgi:hypothetical protein
MAIQTTTIDYPINDATHEAFIAWDDANTVARTGGTRLACLGWTHGVRGGQGPLARRSTAMSGLLSTCTAKVFAAAAPKKMRR